MSLTHLAFALSTLLCAASALVFPGSFVVFLGAVTINATDTTLQNILTVTKWSLATFIFTVFARIQLLS